MNEMNAMMTEWMGKWVNEWEKQMNEVNGKNDMTWDGMKWNEANETAEAIELTEQMKRIEGMKQMKRRKGMKRTKGMKWLKQIKAMKHMKAMKRSQPASQTTKEPFRSQKPTIQKRKCAIQWNQNERYRNQSCFASETNRAIQKPAQAQFRNPNFWFRNPNDPQRYQNDPFWYVTPGAWQEISPTTPSERHVAFWAPKETNPVTQSEHYVAAGSVRKFCVSAFTILRVTAAVKNKFQTADKKGVKCIGKLGCWPFRNLSSRNYWEGLWIAGLAGLWRRVLLKVQHFLE